MGCPTLSEQTRGSLVNFAELPNLFPEPHHTHITRTSHAHHTHMSTSLGDARGEKLAEAPVSPNTSSVGHKRSSSSLPIACLRGRDVVCVRVTALQYEQLQDTTHNTRIMTILVHTYLPHALPT